MADELPEETQQAAGFDQRHQVVIRQHNINAEIVNFYLTRQADEKKAARRRLKHLQDPVGAGLKSATEKPFFGRRGDIDALSARLDSSGVTFLSALPGQGKTRVLEKIRD